MRQQQVSQPHRDRIVPFWIRISPGDRFFPDPVPLAVSALAFCPPMPKRETLLLAVPASLLPAVVVAASAAAAAFFFSSSRFFFKANMMMMMTTMNMVIN